MSQPAKAKPAQAAKVAQADETTLPPEQLLKDTEALTQGLQDPTAPAPARAVGSTRSAVPAAAGAAQSGNLGALGARATAGTRYVPVSTGKAQPEDSLMWKVRDLLATAGPRTHLLNDRHNTPQRYTFPDDQTYVDAPMSTVMRNKLVENDGFEVRNQNGAVMRAVRSVDHAGQKGIVLAHDELVVKYEELITDALVTRAAKAGFVPVKDQDITRDDLINFLIERSILGANGVAAEGEAAAGAAEADSVDLEADEEF